MILKLLLGVLAFILMLGYDLIELYFHRRLLSLFVMGSLFLGIATVLLILDANPKDVLKTAPFLLIGFGLLALLCVYGLFYVLFVALPATDYKGQRQKFCVTNGWYAICRHPSALLFYALYACIALALPSMQTLIALIVFPTVNLFYVAIQDRYIFEKTIANYNVYKKMVPFILPNRASILRALKATGDSHEI